MESIWPNMVSTDKCGNISTLPVVFVSLKMTRYEWENPRYLSVKYFSCQAIVTDFNNHRLLVIKSNFCSAQVFFIFKPKHFLSPVDFLSVPGMWGNQGRGVHATQRCDCWWWRKYHSGGFQESQNSGQSRYIVSWRTTSINTIVTCRFSPPREFLWRSLEPTAPVLGSWTGPVGSPWRPTVLLLSWTSATLEFLCSKSTFPPQPNSGLFQHIVLCRSLAGKSG